MKTGIFVTAYNVEKQIVRKVLSKIPTSVVTGVERVVVVDNCSQDETVERVCAFRKDTDSGDKFLILRNRQNYGYGGSHKVAFRYFLENGYDYAILLHGDGQGDPAYLEKFLAMIEEQRYDFIIGSRFMKGSDLSGYSRIRTTANYFFVFLQKIVSGLTVTDPGSGYIAYNLNVIRSLPYERLTDYFCFDPCLFLMVSKRKPRICEFPINWGEVETSNVNIFEYGLKLLLVLLRYRFAGLPLQDARKDDYEYAIL